MNINPIIINCISNYTAWKNCNNAIANFYYNIKACPSY